MYSLRPHSALSASSTPTVGFVRVASSRARIDRHEPTVGFTISTDRPFAELIVATRPELFLAEAASQRNEGNFFASRAHGLLKGPGELAYMLPAAFVASVVGQTPRPNRLYFLAVGYDNDRAEGATYSVPVQAWGSEIPSLEIAADVHERSVAASLGIALSRLARGNGAERVGASLSAAATAPARGATPGVVWRQEVSATLPRGRIVALSEDDGYAAQPGEVSSVPPQAEPPQGESAESYGYESPAYGSQAYGSQVYGSQAYGSQAYGSQAYEDSSWDDYDDGYDSSGAQGTGTRGGATQSAAALDSAYPAGAEAPTDLPDEEEEGTGNYHDEAELGTAAEAPGNTPSVNAAPAPVGALDKVIDEIVRGGRRSLFTLARPTEGDGVAFGATQATQRSGDLGALLTRLSASDSAAFARCFAPDASALLTTTTAATESARMQPVGGQPLTHESWLRRFAAAGNEPRFVAEQRAFARQQLLEPLLPIVRDLGLGTRGLALLAAVAVARGLDAGLRWVLGGIGPASSPAQLQAALRGLGDADLSAFQRRQGLPPNGELDPRTHARLHAALRGLGERSPVPTLSAQQIVHSLLRQAASEPIHHKLEHLARSPALEDRAL